MSKIWHTALSITTQIYSSIGIKNDNGVDKIVWNKSHQSNKNVSWLEEQVEALICFDNSDIEEQRKTLTQIVRNKQKVIQEINEIIESWNTVNIDRLLKVLHTSIEESPTLFNCLIFERNIKWIDNLLEALKSNTPTLFVVGALHCVGNNSILDILNKKYGYPSNLIL